MISKLYKWLLFVTFMANVAGTWWRARLSFTSIVSSNTGTAIIKYKFKGKWRRKMGRVQWWPAQPHIGASQATKSPSAAYGYHTEGFSGLSWFNIGTHKHHYFLSACPSSSSVQISVFRCVRVTWRKGGGLIKSDWLWGWCLLGLCSSQALAVGKRKISQTYESAEGTARPML